MIKSKEEFAEYCLRKLGKPVIVINVDESQVEDRINDAVQVWQEKHYDATEKTWLGYTVTSEDVERGYIKLPSDIHIVSRVLPLTTLYNDLGGPNGVFSFNYQFMLHNMSPWQPLDTLNYYLMKTNIGEVNDLVNSTPRFEFTKHKNKLVIYDGNKHLKEGTKVAFEVYRYLDGTVDVEMWNDKWLKEYATALIKKQWGQNMIKHSGIQLLGGVTIEGSVLIDAANQEIEKLEEQLSNTYEEPIDFFIG